MKRSTRISILTAFVLGSLLSTFITLAIVRPGLARANASSATPTAIYACVDQNGKLRIVSATATCKPNETALQWNQQGTAGGGFSFLICPSCDFSEGGDTTRFKGGDFTNAYIPQANFTNLDLTGAIFNHANATDSNFGPSAILVNADFTSANLTYSRFRSDDGTDGNGSPATATNATGANFTDANLTNVNTSFGDYGKSTGIIFYTNFTGANFTSANLSGSWFLNTNFTNANLTGANLTGADLTSSPLTGAILTGVTWSNTTCPDGTNSDSNGNTCSGHL